jgi:hypothetical protein
LKSALRAVTIPVRITSLDRLWLTEEEITEAPLDLITSALLVLLFLFVWLTSPRLCRFWQYVLAEGLTILGLRAAPGLREHALHPVRSSLSSYRRHFSRCANLVADTGNLLRAAGGEFSFAAKTHSLELSAAAGCVMHTTRLLVFLWEPARFPHTPDSYMEGLVGYGIALISFVPILFGFT